MGHTASSEAPLIADIHNAEASTSLVLVAYSAGVRRKGFFERKLTKILSKIGEYSVMAVNDRGSLISRACAGKISHAIDTKGLSRTQIKSLVAKATHVVVFWDGGHDLCDFVYFASLLHKPHRIVPVITTKVANKDRGEEFDVYIGRGSPWGNPFAIWENGNDRQSVIEKFQEYFEETILADPIKRKALIGLKGKTLGCHCKPLACHGDVIADYLNSLEDEGNEE